MKRETTGSSGSGGSGLGELLSLGLEAGEPWTTDQLKAVLEEQMSVSLEIELAAFKTEEVRSLRASACAQGLVLKSLGELLKHPVPPLDLLVLAKDYFKANTAYVNPDLPGEVARALYFVTIGVAWSRHQKSISQLSQKQLAEGLGWVKRQPWLTDELRSVLEEAAQYVNADEKE